jgi:hypothetical protein
MSETKHGTELLGPLRHDTKGWHEYVIVNGVFVKHWIWDRLHEIPEGAVVRISVEVLDPHPE